MSQPLNHLGQPIGWPVRDWVPPPPPPRAPMRGHFCCVEPLDADHHAAELHAANQADAEGRMWTYLAYGPFASLEAYRAWVEPMSASADPLCYAIVDGASGRALGVASYLRIAPDAGSIEIGHLAFAPALQRSPVATEALFLLMERAFTLGYRRLEWKCDALNEPSRAAARRLGFSFEGIFRQATVYKGRNRDTAWYSVVDGEWPALQAAFRRWLDPANFDQHGRQRLRLSALTRPLLYREG